VDWDHLYQPFARKRPDRVDVFEFHGFPSLLDEMFRRLRDWSFCAVFADRCFVCETNFFDS
jgi:hypothetical protein